MEGLQDASRIRSVAARDGIDRGDLASTRVGPALRRGARAVVDGVRAQSERWGLWTPIAFGLGCALYFALRVELAAWPINAAAGLLIFVAIAARRRGPPLLAVAAVLAACAASGLAVAKLRSDAVAGPVLVARDAPWRLEGWVVDVVSPGAGGSRVLIAPVRIEGLAPEATPARVRVTLDGPPPAPGDAVRLTALLNPPPPPAAPGAYDFARDAWFHSVGAVGYALTPPRSVGLPPPPARLRLHMRINEARWALTHRLVERVGPSAGGIAAAMTTGHKAFIPAEDLQAMRDAGLAHLLAISGLHMAIVGGFAFFALRVLIAAVPPLALRAPGKKLAAVGGLAAVCVYLVISGAPAPAERAAVVAACAFTAVLIDRRAISLNALAFAAFVVMVLRPESVVQPGFQMSFGATAALVALAEAWPRRVKEIQAPWPITAVQRARDWLAAACAASFVAGLATGPVAMQHFNRTAVYGLAANLLVAPISSFLTMPALATGAALEPLGLGGPLLAAAGWGVDATTAVARAVAALPGAVRQIPSAPAAALPIALVGIFWMCVWKGRGRWFGAPLACAVLLWPRPEPGHLWIAADGAAAVVRSGSVAVLMRPEAKRFGAEFWAKRRGLSQPADEIAARDARFDCGRTACTPKAAAEVKVSAWWGRRAPSADRVEALCADAEVVVSRARLDRLPPGCAGVLVLDAQDFARGESMELWRRPEGWVAVRGRDLRGRRPWVADGGGVSDSDG